MVELVEALRDATSYYKRHLAGIDIASTHSILKSQAPVSTGLLILSNALFLSDLLRTHQLFVWPVRCNYYTILDAGAKVTKSPLTNIHSFNSGNFGWCLVV